jgi:5-aminopentanamidase
VPAAFDNHLVRVAVCQLSLQVGQVAGNRAAALDVAVRAADRGARIIVLPELTPSGYVFASPQEARSVVDTEFGRVAVMICYDAEFPEWVRLPALAGADLLAVPTNWPAEPVPPGERPMVVANVQAAAFANRMFVAAACRCGPERGVSWVGGSLIAGPDGYPLAGPAGADDPELLLADCDLARARTKATSPRNDPHLDRRPTLYG